MAQRANLIDFQDVINERVNQVYERSERRFPRWGISLLTLTTVRFSEQFLFSPNCLRLSFFRQVDTSRYGIWGLLYSSFIFRSLAWEMLNTHYKIAQSASLGMHFPMMLRLCNSSNHLGTYSESFERNSGFQFWRLHLIFCIFQIICLQKTENGLFGFGPLPPSFPSSCPIRVNSSLFVTRPPDATNKVFYSSSMAILVILCGFIYCPFPIVKHPRLKKKKMEEKKKNSFPSNDSVCGFNYLPSLQGTFYEFVKSISWCAFLNAHQDFKKL